MAFETATRLDAMTVREKDGKKFWTRLGVAWPAKQGPGWNVVLDAMPAPADGQFKIFLMAPKPRDGANTDTGRAAGSNDDFDSVPF